MSLTQASLQQTGSSFLIPSLRKIMNFHLISWHENLVETYSFHKAYTPES